MSKLHSLKKLVIAGVAGTISAISVQGSAEASLIGDQILGCVSLNDICPSGNLFSNSSATVGVGIEFFGNVPFGTPGAANLIGVEADFSESMFTITTIANIFDFGSLPDLFWEFENLNWTDSPGKIVDVIELSTPGTGFDVTFGDDFININTDNFIQFGFGEVRNEYKFQIVTEHKLVPETSFTLSLLTLGTIGSSLILKRKLKTS